MTEYQVEWYLGTLKTALQRELVRDTADDDYYQQASMDLLRDCAKYEVNNEKDFTGLFCRYFLTIRKRHVANHCARQREQGITYSLSDYCDSMGDYHVYHFAEDPRKDPMIEACEYIDLLPLAYRRVFLLLFVEGVTQQEASEVLGVTMQRVSQMVQEGSQIIRDELAAIG